MADENVDLDYIVLNHEMWPGRPDLMMGVPPDGFAGASHHNVIAPVYRLGQKIQVRNTGVVAGLAGLSVFIYLKLEYQDLANILAVKEVVALHSDANGTDVTNDLGTDLGNSVGPLAVALGAMTTDYYGWFWCGGVCPEEFVPTLTGNIRTDGTLAIGGFGHGPLATPGATVGEIGLMANATNTSTVCGYAMHADA